MLSRQNEVATETQQEQRATCLHALENVRNTESKRNGVAMQTN